MKVIFLGFKTCYANVFRNELFYFEDINEEELIKEHEDIHIVLEKMMFV